jgi:hypothetical protein
MVEGQESIDGHDRFELPFGYYLERDADLLVLRRSDGTFVAAFNVGAWTFSRSSWRCGKMPISSL